MKGGQQRLLGTSYSLQAHATARQVGKDFWAQQEFFGPSFSVNTVFYRAEDSITAGITAVNNIIF